MYLTRFRLNTARPGARRLLSSPQVTHAAVLSGFPELRPTAEHTPRVLWRLDRDAAAEVLLYVVSPHRPDLTHLVEQAGWPAAAASGTPGWQTYAYVPFLERLEKGAVWNFRLTANPVHYARTRDDQATTKRTAHITPRHQLQWLLQRQDAGGFRIAVTTPAEGAAGQAGEAQAVVRDQRTVNFAKKGAGGRRVTLATVTFDGRLEVTDPDALRHVLTAGIGRAKAYGCGLMTLAPVG